MTPASEGVVRTVPDAIADPLGDASLNLPSFCERIGHGPRPGTERRGGNVE
jgi:hypothetical protein